MYSVNDIKVELMNPEEVKNFIKNHGVFACQCYMTPEKFAERVGLSCLKDGHTSGSRADYFKFRIKCPRYCYDEKTEILTIDGWKYIKDIEDDEIVATRNPETGMVEFHQINEKIMYMYKGEMHSIQKTNVDLVVTSNHRMYYKKHDVRVNKDQFYITPISDIDVNRIKLNKEFDYYNEVEDTIEIKGYSYYKKQSCGDHIKLIEKYTGDLKLDRETFFAFLAWYLSDGHTVYDKNENKYVINITQTKCEENLRNKTRERIIELIERLGFHACEYERGICFNSMTLGRFLKQLGTCEKKYIPYNLYEEFNKEYAQIFLREYFKGDGHIDKNGCGKFYTCSKKLADQLQELTFMAGWTAMIYTRGEHLVGTKHEICGRTVNINYIGYVVNVSFNKVNREPYVNLRDDRIKYYTEEPVYCVNVPNHIIFVRRNGKAVWCCNCGDQIMRHSIGTAINCQSQRYVDMDENFSIFVPQKVMEDEELRKMYQDYEDNCREQYKSIREKMNKREITGEQANDLMRTMLPIGVECNITMGFTIEALIHFMHKRLCKRADAPIRKVAQLMRDEVLKIEPRYKDFLVPQCVDLMYCPERHSCGMYPSKKEVQELIKLGKNCCKNKPEAPGFPIDLNKK